MNINIKGKNIELTDAIVSYVREKLDPVSKLIDVRDDGAHADVEVGKTTHHHNKGDIFRAEITLFTKGQSLRTVTEKDDLYASIDEMKDGILAEVKKTKQKREGVIRRGQKKIKDMIKGIFNK